MDGRARMRTLRAGLGALLLSLLPVAALATDRLVAAHLESLRGQFDPRVAATLERIDGLGRQLLAARSYVRAEASLDQRWSWSRQQIERYEGSALQRALEAELARVRAVFEAENPGYTLWVNPQVRSVELQVERWNANATVDASAAAMLAAIRSRVAARDAPRVGSPEARKWFAGLLRATAPTPTPSLAAPGLSRHGRMQAVDFQVKQGERTVAGASQDDIAGAWEAQGWCERLVSAVRTASDRFEGPLVHPNEPWHYEYQAPAHLVARAGD